MRAAFAGEGGAEASDMKSVYRYRKERRFDIPPEAIWPFVADTARINELVGFPPYSIEERADADGRIRRVASAKVGPIGIQWEESFGEWRENRQVVQNRRFLNGPFRAFRACAELHREGEGSRLTFSSDIECVGVLGLLARLSGQIGREGDRRVAAIESMISAASRPGETPGASAEVVATPSARRRLAALIADLDRDPMSHGLAPKLSEFLLHAPAVALRCVRPLAMARLWGASADATVALFLAAQRVGLLAMGWDLLCPRCRGAPSRVQSLQELPKGAHCSSCNVDFARNFTRNVELTFRPEPWLRPLPQGEFCLLGQGATPHVKFQAEVAAGAAESFPLSLPPGDYRFRTLEAGAEADASIGADGILPSLRAWGDDILLAPGRRDEFVVHNDTRRPLFFVIEDRAWAKDALTGEAVIAMQAFRRLCPEQLLRAGDEVEIGRVAILFTDLLGSTKLYDELGDAKAYRLVRDHFAFLSEVIERHGGCVVKTVGDAVMAAFRDPAKAVRAALAIHDETESFNQGRDPHGIVLKLGLHVGACIAVTAGGVLDYFGSAVNTAARLQHQCQGGEAILSASVLADAEALEALEGRSRNEDTATLRGLAEPVRFTRLDVSGRRLDNENGDCRGGGARP
jgi:class 3 adenylate cyclase